MTREPTIPFSCGQADAAALRPEDRNESALHDAVPMARTHLWMGDAVKVLEVFRFGSYSIAIRTSRRFYHAVRLAKLATADDHDRVPLMVV